MERGDAASRSPANTDANLHPRLPQAPDWLLAESRIVRVNRGELLLQSGDAPEHVYLVRSGRILIYYVDSGGQEKQVVMVPGDGIVGEMEILAGAERTVYSARAFEESELVRVPAAAFLKWARIDADVSRELNRMLAEKLYDAALRSSQYTGTDAVQRLTDQLAQLGPGRLNYTRLELAELCSVSVRTVNRCVKRLHDEGLIGLSRGKIEISRSQLEALAKRIHTDI